MNRFILLYHSIESQCACLYFNHTNSLYGPLREMLALFDLKKGNSNASLSIIIVNRSFMNTHSSGDREFRSHCRLARLQWVYIAIVVANHRNWENCEIFFLEVSYSTPTSISVFFTIWKQMKHQNSGKKNWEIVTTIANKTISSGQRTMDVRTIECKWLLKQNKPIRFA